MKPQIDGLGRLGGLVAEILVARAFGVKEVLHTHTYILARISKHEPTHDGNWIEDSVEVYWVLDRQATKFDGGNQERNCGRVRAGSYGLREAWLAANGADEVEDGLGGLDEVGMAGDLGVRLRLLHAPQLRTAVTAPQ